MGEAEQTEEFPKPVQGLDPRGLPLQPEEAFVLSRVDGHSSLRDIAASTALEVPKVRLIIAKLIALGAVFTGDEGSAPRVSAPIPLAPRGNADVAIVYDFEIEPDIHLDATQQREIRQLDDMLGALTHYELLGVLQGATRQEIKDAYFSIVGRFHPDRYFRKPLGTYAPRLERIFSRMTTAYDTLRKEEHRQRYDRSLAVGDAQSPASSHRVATRQAPTPRRSPIQEVVGSRSTASVRPLAATPAGSTRESAAPAQHAAASAPPPPFSERKPVSSNAPRRPEVLSSKPPPESSDLQAADRRRREVDQALRGSVPPPGGARQAALLRKLRASVPPSRHSSAPSPSFHPTSGASALTPTFPKAPKAPILSEELERAAEYGLKQERQHPADRAAQLLRSLRPGDPRGDAGRQQAAEELGIEAQREESEGAFEDAAFLYARAAEGKPELRFWAGAARCFFQGKVDLKRAAEYAKRCLDLQPENPQYHLLLAEIYKAADMTKSATRHVQRVLEIDPGNRVAQTLLATLSRSKQ